MKIAIIDTSVKSALSDFGTVNVHTSNCMKIKRELESKNHRVYFFLSDSENVNTEEQFDIILISYGSFYFDFKKYKTLCENQLNCKIGWLTNEYDLTPNSCFTGMFDFIISNFEKGKKWKNQEYLMVNLNAMIYEDSKAKVESKYETIYYGTYRKDRESYFLKYLNGQSVFLSTSSKNLKKYKNLGTTCRYTKKMSWFPRRETLRLFKKSLYIEDTYTHTCYNHLANRFYESIMCEVVPVFDQSCMNTINKSNFPKEMLSVIDNRKDLDLNHVADFKKLKEITRQEKEEALSKIVNFIEKIAN